MMNKPWQPYALHILDALEKIRRIVASGDIIESYINYQVPKYSSHVSDFGYPS